MIGFYNYTVYMTFLGLVSSAYGLVMAATGHPLRALAMLMFSGICDMFDGKIARTKKGRTESEKKFGIQIDSLSDLLAFGVLPAILEEFLFRGIVLAEYSPYGAGTAVLFSSLLFSFMHFTPVRFPIYFFTGIILALTVSACGSVITTGIIHAAYNVFTLYFEKYIYKVAAKQSGGMILLTFIVVTVLLVSAVLFFGKAERMYRLMGEANLPSPLRRKKAAGDPPAFFMALLSPTFIILLVFYLVVSFFF